MTLHAYLRREIIPIWDYLHRRIELFRRLLCFFDGVASVKALEMYLERRGEREPIVRHEFEKAVLAGVFSIVADRAKRLELKDLYSLGIRLEMSLDIGEVPIPAYAELHPLPSLDKKVYGDIVLDAYKFHAGDLGVFGCLAELFVRHPEVSKYFKSFTGHIASVAKEARKTGIVVYKAVLGYTPDAVDWLTEPQVYRFHRGGEGLLSDVLKTIAREGASEREKKVYKGLRPYKRELIVGNLWRFREFKSALVRIAAEVGVSLSLSKSVQALSERPDAMAALYNKLLVGYFEPLSEELMGLEEVRAKFERIVKKQMTLF